MQKSREDKLHPSLQKCLAARGWEVGGAGDTHRKMEAWLLSLGDKQLGEASASSILNTQKRCKGSPPCCFPASKFEEGDALLARPFQGGVSTGSPRP